MTHEEMIKRSEENIAKSKELVALMKELIQTTNKKLRRLDDKDMRSLPSLLGDERWEQN